MLSVELMGVLKINSDDESFIPTIQFYTRLSLHYNNI